METARQQTTFTRRFSQQFFSRLPETSGILFLLDSKRNLLVSSATENIKERALSFKLMLENQSKNLPQELLTETHNIKWSECPSQALAEKILIDLDIKHPPKYKLNTAEKNQVGHYFSISIIKNSLVFNLSAQASDNPCVFGSFKNKNLCQNTMSALIRFSHCFINRQNSTEWPLPLTKLTLPSTYQLHDTKNKSEVLLLSWQQQIADFFNGNNQLLLNSCQSLLDSPQFDKFTQIWLTNDYKHLVQFFKTNSLRNKELRRILNLGTNTTASYWLNDISRLIRS